MVMVRRKRCTSVLASTVLVNNYFRSRHNFDSAMISKTNSGSAVSQMKYCLVSQQGEVTLVQPIEPVCAKCLYVQLAEAYVTGKRQGLEDGIETSLRGVTGRKPGTMHNNF
jgi:hypothetical protein